MLWDWYQGMQYQFVVHSFRVVFRTQDLEGLKGSWWLVPYGFNKQLDPKKIKKGPKTPKKLEFEIENFLYL